MYIKKRRNRSEKKAFGPDQTFCLTESLELYNRLHFHILNVMPTVK
jgi:hypothetical protein